MSDKYYDFDSGNLALDFANTSDWHGSDQPQENLTGYDDLVTWGEQGKLLTMAQAESFRQAAARQPEEASRVFQRALSLREAIYRIFSSLYAGRSLSADELATLNAELKKAMPNLELVLQTSGLEWRWLEGTNDLDRMLWPVARATAQLLTSDQLDRVRECEDDRGCGYLFIDQSKNHSRRWCSMESCGNRAKARRHYARQQDLRA